MNTWRAVDQLAGVMHTRWLWWRALDRSIPDRDNPYDRHRATASTAIDALVSGTPEHRALTIRSLVGTRLIDPIPDRDWWATSLGQLIVCTVGHPSLESVSMSVAAAMLSVNGSRVTQLIAAGVLVRDGAGVSVASVQARAAVMADR